MEEKLLQVGDKVTRIGGNGRPVSIKEVLRVTKTTAILTDGTVLYRDNLREKGADKWAMHRFKLTTLEHATQIAESNLRNQTIKTFDDLKGKLTTAQLRAILDILETQIP